MGSGLLAGSLINSLTQQVLIENVPWARSPWILKAGREEQRIKARAGDGRKEPVKGPGRPHGDTQA